MEKYVAFKPCNELIKLKEINNLFDSSIETSKEAAAQLLNTNFKADARSIREKTNNENMNSKNNVSIKLSHTFDDSSNHDADEEDEEDEISEVCFIFHY